MHYTFPITRNENPKPKPDPKDMGFAKYFTDHMPNTSPTICSS